MSFSLNTPPHSHSSTNTHTHTHTQIHPSLHDCEKLISVVYNPPSLWYFVIVPKWTKTLTFMHPHWHTYSYIHTHTPTHIPHTYKKLIPIHTHIHVYSLCSHDLPHISHSHTHTHTHLYSHFTPSHSWAVLIQHQVVFFWCKHPTKTKGHLTFPQLSEKHVLTLFRE